MVSDTRSTHKSTRQATESPPSVRKSKRLENETPPMTPPVKRMSERLGKCNTLDSLRRSGMGKKELSSRSVSKEFTEDALSNSKRNKEKTVIQVTIESEKAELDPEVVGMKRKSSSARKFKARFKRQRIVPDGGDELERSENLGGASSDNGSGINSQAVEDTEDVGDDCSKRVEGKLRDKSISKVSEGALPDSASRDYPAVVENDINVDSCIRDYVVDDPGSKYTTYCSSDEDKDSESPRECSTGGNCSRGSKYYKVAEDTASASLVCGYCDLEGTCLLCSKIKRVRYDLPEQELCSCSPMGEDLVDVAESSTNDAEVLCGSCNKDGDLLTCEGKNCRNCYHLLCLDPPLTEALPGSWHCPQCVKKKLLLGVHSVSTGVESIWDIREVVVPNAEGVQQRQFLVKYNGLAHVHNHWVPETQLLLETPCLVSNFLEKDQDTRWNAKWMAPHRLLWKRPIQDSIYVASTTVIWVCEYEWLVKWRDLDYDHATWELDNAKFLSSSVSQDLVRNYEARRGKAKSEANKPHMEPIIGHSEIPGGSHETHVLENVNKVRKFLLKCPNAVVIDDQDRTTTAIYLIHSMIETFRSFLIVATHDTLSRWEADFERLVPSVDVVVYSGSVDTRDVIRASEFYDEGRCIVQVLLSSVEAVLEDLEILKKIKWKAIVIDEYQYSGIPEGLEQIKILSTDMRVLIVSSQIKDATSEYLKILYFVEPRGDFDKLRSLKSETNDNLSKLKERLSSFIVHVHTSQAPKFIEYWVPVQMSNLQLEHYCATLLSHSNALCSCLRKDPCCVLPEVLLTVRKCCQHPYLVDPSVQASLIADKHPTHVVMDVGIKASGKLQLLDVMLSEIKTRGLRVLILYQLISSGKLSSGSILNDLLFHRFGVNKYEHVDAACIKSEKQAAADRFNKKTTGQLVFLLDNRACSSCIKLSSLDIVVIYDSDWNPANDLRALKKVPIDSKVEAIKVLRLYSSFTIEERALLLAKQKLNLDHSSSNFSRSTSNTLLSWGATYLFNKLDEYHADSNSSLALDLSGQLLLDKVTKEFHAILSENFKNADSNSAISEAKSDVGSYSTNTLVFGESKVQLKGGEEHHVFWKNLFEGKNPLWKHLTGPSPRNRKKVHYGEGSVDISEAVKDNMAKKRQKMVNESLGPGSCQVELSATKVAEVIVSNKGPSAINSCHQSESFHSDGQSLLDEVSVIVASKERIVPSDEQQSTVCVLQRGVKTLCQRLNLPDTDALHEENRTALQIEIATSELKDSATPVSPNFESPITDDIVTPEASDKAPVELQDTDALHEENRGAPQIEIATSEPTDSVTPVPPNFESSVTDDIVSLEVSDKAPVELQDTDALYEENRSAPQIEIATSEPKDSATPVPPNFESPVTDDIVTPEASDKAPVEFQDTDALHEENRSAPQIEIAMSEPTDSVAPVPPNFESSVTDDIVSLEVSDKAPVDEVFGQLHSLAVDISLSCDQLPATEHRDQERSSPQTAEPEETEVVLHQSISQADKNSELHACRVSVVASTSNQPNQAVMENDVAVPQAMVSTSEQPNQDVPNPPVVGIDTGNLHGTDFILNPTRQPIWSSAPPSLTDPLQNEIVRIQKETEQLEKSHADMMSQLKADCEKEIEKIIAQVRNKYEVKSGETDAEFRVKMNELDKNQNTVCLNKMLANAFGSKCLDVRPSGSPSIQQGTSTSMLPPSVRPSPGPSASQPAPSIDAGISTSILPPSVSPSQGPPASQPAPSIVAGISTSILPPSVSPSQGPPASQPALSPTSAPAAATAPGPALTRTLPTTSPAFQQPSWSHLMRSSPSAIRNMTAHPIQGLQRAAAHVSGNSARPPIISAITPADLRASSEIRSVLPHLQSCRAVAGASMSAPTSSSASQLQPIQTLPMPPSQPGLLPRPPLVAQNSPEARGVLGAPPGFRRPYLSENRNASVPDIPSTFRPLERSDLEMLGNASVRPAVHVEASVVCLSDDE